MKKQFFRVKQLADQTFLRAEKSKVLVHEELQVADHKVEYLRNALTAINKKIPPTGPHNDAEKRSRKSLEYQLGIIFLEQSGKKREGEIDHDECRLFQEVIRDAGAIEQQLAKEYAEHEMKVEEMISVPIQKLVDNEFPNIAKQKRNLQKYCLDKDSASNRYNATKKEALKDDMEEADIKVEQCRDALAIEMFSLLSRENEFATHILQLLKLQRAYHESALNNLQNVIPELEKKIGESSVKRVFGMPLHDHLKVTGKRIAYPLEICIPVLSEIGMHEEGLFRLTGGMSKVKRLKAAIDSGCFNELIPEYRDVHVIASTLKSYLRELPEPLLTYRLHNEWMQVAQYPDNQRTEAIRRLLGRLPRENMENLTYLMQFFAKLTHHSVNKMTASNIAIVLAPNLLWEQNCESMNMGNCASINMLVELFINKVDVFFSENVSQFVTPMNLLYDDDRRDDGDSNHVDFNVSMESIQITESPKPNTRKKKAAPVPPGLVSKTDNDLNADRISMSSSYPSGSSTLTRPKTRVKTSTGTNTDAEISTLTRRPSFQKKEEEVSNLVIESVDQAPPIEEKSYKTTATHVISKPMAAPRSFHDGDRKIVVTRSSSIRCTPTYDNLSKSVNSVDAFGDVQLRRSEVDRLNNKPEIPARPASLQKRSSLENADGVLQRTQCSVYSVANKQQPSFVNIPNRNEKFQLGHDILIGEKEKFLGHQPQVVPMPRTSLLENKFNDVNSNSERAKVGTVEAKPNVPPKSLSKGGHVTKSNEKINDVCGNVNGNQKKPSHARTRSDGNLIDLNSDIVMQTPPSPRSLNKPTEPPPPPPVAASSPKARTDGDSTDL